jgi:Spx/MgsR family transcriptional regulator
MKWFDAHGLDFQFVDIRATPPDHDRIARWLDTVGNDRLINRRSATWRGLTETERGHSDGPAAAGLLCQHPTLIKRPVIEQDGNVCVGFSDDIRARLGGA